VWLVKKRLVVAQYRHEFARDEKSSIATSTCRSELVRVLLQSIEQISTAKPEYPTMTSLGIVESDFDAASSYQKPSTV
jgi:hypothetical protein